MCSATKFGWVAEWFIAHAWKACTPRKRHRGFESLPIRQFGVVQPAVASCLENRHDLERGLLGSTPSYSSSFAGDRGCEQPPYNGSLQIGACRGFESHLRHQVRRDGRTAIASASKADMPQGIGGSNPSLSSSFASRWWNGRRGPARAEPAVTPSWGFESLPSRRRASGL
jgi:hypothetical protein